MHDFLFYLFAALTLLCGLLVVANPFSRNPVTSAMFLVLTIVSLAGLFVLLNAYFLAAIQILVYAGAVMVLFLFVIMMLNVKEEQRRKTRLFGLIAGGFCVAAIFLIFSLAMLKSPLPVDSAAPTLEGSTIALGRILFNFQNRSPQFLLPFEIVSVLLLVAMVGVILLSKKDLK